MTYKTSLDNLAKGITIAISLLFLVIIIVELAIIPQEGFLISLSTAVALIASYAFTLAFRPINYSLTADNLIIHRLLRDVVIDRKVISSVELIDKEKIKGSIRTFGVGGLFGYFGNFVNTSLGRMTWYATRRDNIILVQTIGKKKIILTPNEPIEFVTDYNLQAAV